MAPYSAVHVRGGDWTISETLHVVVTCVMVLSILLAVGFGAVTLGPRFRRYSLGTLVLLGRVSRADWRVRTETRCTAADARFGDRRARQRLRVSPLGRGARDRASATPQVRCADGCSRDGRVAVYRAIARLGAARGGETSSLCSRRPAAVSTLSASAVTQGFATRLLVPPQSTASACSSTLPVTL